VVAIAVRARRREEFAGGVAAGGVLIEKVKREK